MHVLRPRRARRGRYPKEVQKPNDAPSDGQDGQDGQDRQDRHDGQVRRHQPSHRRAKKHSRILILLLALALVAVVAGAGVGVTAYRMSRETAPVLQATTVLGSEVPFPGSPPALSWPTQGQAAVVVAGLGSLGSSGPRTPQPIASVTKMMTAYVILHDFPLAPGSRGFTINVTSEDVSDTDERAAQAQSVAKVMPGETLTEYQLLEGLLVPSANNFAVMLAEHDGGVPAFVAKMNSMAAALGMRATVYTDPSGFDPTTVSTASDQTVLGEVVMRQPVIAQIVAERSITLPVAGTLANFGDLVGMDGFIGIKTGSDSTAGGSFVFANQRSVGGHTVTIYGAVIGQDVGGIETPALLAAAQGAARRLVDSAAAAISVGTIVPPGTPVMTVTNPEKQVVIVSTTRPLVRLGWGGMAIPLRITPGTPGRQLAEGQQLAIVTVGAGAPAAGAVGADSTTAVAATSMPPLSFHWKLNHAL
jgi:D-alanyl-D-alanine carboxypeptidase (penicillin-binding protein 5/6)